MSREKVAAILAETGLPVVYNKSPEGYIPTYPYIRYIEDERADFCADNTHFCNIETWQAFLVSETKNDSAQEKLESALSSSTEWSKTVELNLDTENLYQVEYDFVTIK